MTNYKQPPTGMTTIEEIVEEFSKQNFILQDCDWCDGLGFTNNPVSTNPIKKCERCNGIGTSRESRKLIETWLTQTLKDYGDAVREEERKSILKAYQQTTGIKSDLFIKSLKGNHD